MSSNITKNFISIYSSSNPVLTISPILKDGVGIYLCMFNDPWINIKTAKDSVLKLFSYDTKKIILSKDSDENGNILIKFKPLKLNSQYKFNISIFKKNIKIYNYDLVIVIKDVLLKYNHYIENKKTNSKDIEIVNGYKLDSNIKISDIFSLKIDFMQSVEQYYHAEKNIYSNSEHPTIKLPMDDTDEFEISILGFENYLILDPEPIKGYIEKFDRYVYFSFLDCLKFPGKYLLYIKVTDTKNRVLKDENFVNLNLSFENRNIPNVTKVHKNKIYGDNLISKNEIKVFLLDKDNKLLDEIYSGFGDDNGRFFIELDFKYTKIYEQKFALRSKDIYGNLSPAVFINLDN